MLLTGVRLDLASTDVRSKKLCPTDDSFLLVWSSQEEAVAELSGKPEGTFLLRMSQTDAETYSISVV
jgi:hypothetical protein